MPDLPKCTYCGVRRTRTSLSTTGDPEMHGGCRKRWRKEQASLIARSATRAFICDVCGLPGVQQHKRGRPQMRHGHCLVEYKRRYAASLYSPAPIPARFVPTDFDAAMERGRAFYRAGVAGDDYPSAGYAVSAADRASYALGLRHAKEFPNDATR